ncbi:Oxysterol-binding protein 2 [Goodea atripinnis]|uniref:Oxysterol-binding protein n=1 Tax=Goodea atripinnis TaxID=208336 RepID=A0ABV0NY04_9TELE
MSPSCNDVSGKELLPRRQRRTYIPDKPNYSLNLWSIMKNCIGKELSKIPMPVNFNEPLSMLQRLTEDLEYHELLDKAARCESSLEQMCLVAAFSVSSYSTTVHRTAKPFNPLLGETYELDRLEEFGYRSLCEQVSHHPPAAAHHVISQRGWTLWQEITIASKFRGKYLSIMPLGAIHLQFHSSGNHYVWRKVTSTVHNIIVGKLWIDQSGDIEIVNNRTKETCQLKFSPYSYFSRDVPRKVTGVVADSGGQAHYILSGTWDDKMESAKIIQSSRGGSGSEGKQKTVYQTLSPKLLWKKYPLPENAENMYHFSALALTLNEPEDGVALTDSRLRPDQRLMEEGRWDEANSEKQRLEEKQRAARRRRDAEATDALDEGMSYISLHFTIISLTQSWNLSSCVSLLDKCRILFTVSMTSLSFPPSVDVQSVIMSLCNLRHDGVSYSTPTTSSSTSGSDNTIGIFVSGTGVGCVRSSRQVMVVTETDRAGSCCTPLCRCDKVSFIISQLS